MIYAYVSISKDTSDTENQVAEIERYFNSQYLSQPPYLIGVKPPIVVSLTNDITPKKLLNTSCNN